MVIQSYFKNPCKGVIQSFFRLVKNSYIFGDLWIVTSERNVLSVVLINFPQEQGAGAFIARFSSRDFVPERKKKKVNTSCPGSHAVLFCV